jgi:beta-lactam-binding protein with PASTA domain
MRRFFRGVLLAMILLAVALASALTSMRLAIHGRETRVPKLTGLSLQEAQQATAKAGLTLTLENSFYSADVAKGNVLSQYPAANDKVRRGWRVRIATSLGSQAFPVPDLAGQSPHAADINLQRRGFRSARTATINSSGMPGGVVAQSPSANAERITEPKVDLLIAAAPEPSAYAMPQFVGTDVSSAVSAIHSAGLDVSVHYTAAPAGSNAQRGIILAQAPLAGQRVTRARVITLDVAQ